MTAAPETTALNEKDDEEWADFVSRFEGYDLTEFENISPLTPHSKARTGDTMLHIVVLGEEIEDARLLLRRGASPNEPGERDFTPVHVAALMGNLELLEMLLAFGGDLSAQNDVGDTPMQLARIRGFENAALSMENWSATGTKLPRQ